MDASFKSAGHASPGHVRGFSKNRSLRPEGRSARKNRALLIPRAWWICREQLRRLARCFYINRESTVSSIRGFFLFLARVLPVFPAEHCKRRANSDAGFDASGENLQKNAERCAPRCSKFSE